MVELILVSRVPMSPSGQSRRFGAARATSAFPAKAEVTATRNALARVAFLADALEYPRDLNGGPFALSARCRNAYLCDLNHPCTPREMIAW
jgi:hypothetical protein